ncbi:hypothetical protein FACS1894216_01830 [Synergistales bacterium]|nr:hypothetical protein FACS1894216_01830 [Synergistales bacterium]
MGTTEQDGNTEAKNSGAEETERFDYDGFWKELVKRFFYLLIKRAIPSLYEEADRDKEPEFLDKEFQDILLTSDKKIRKNPHYADLLVKVPLKNGDARWILCHCEAQQSRGDSELPERMSFYHSLIYAHYRKEPVALAIITGVRPKKEEKSYSHYHFGTRLIYEYNNLVLSELDDVVLLASDNPIDLVLYAAKFAMGTNEEHQKFNFLRKTSELLNERGWSAEDKRDLLLFAATIVNMKDEALITQYYDFLLENAKEGKGMYNDKKIYDRFLLLGSEVAEIKQQGMEQGMEKAARNLLAHGIPLDIIAETTELPLDKIQALAN